MKFLPMLLPFSLIVSAILSPAGEEEKTLKGKAVKFPRAPESQTSRLSTRHAVGEGLQFGSGVFPVRTNGKKLIVATKPGGPISTTVKVGKPVNLAWKQDGKRRKLTVGFEPSASGEWQYYVASSYRYKLCGQELSLVDCNGDGEFGNYAKDGYCYGDSTAVCPLAEELVIGTSIVTIHEVAPDGSSPLRSGTGQARRLPMIRESSSGLWITWAIGILRS